MNWPGPNDPYYLYNPTDNMARRTYYNVSGTPTVKADGILGAGATQASYTSAYNTRNAVDSPVEIDMTVEVSSNIDVAIDVTARDGFTANGLTYHTVLIARDIDTTGAYSQTNYQWVMLDMAPSASGQNFNVTSGQTTSMNASFPIPNWLGLEEMAIVGFVQRNDTKEVLNAKYAQIPLDFPWLSLSSYSVIDNIGGTPNNIPEAGETCHLFTQISNVPPFATATNVQLTLTTNDPDITIIDGQCSIPDIIPGEIQGNSEDPFVFEISDDISSHLVTFRLAISADGFNSAVNIVFLCGLPELVIIDDDGGSWETYLQGDLDALGIGYLTWNTALQGSPSADYLCNFDKVIWHTGMATSTLSMLEQLAVTGYLDNGGKLFMTSENLGDDIGTTMFYQDYFHAVPLVNHITTTTLAGIAGNPISNGTNLLLLGGAYWPDQQSTITVSAGAEILYKYNNTNLDAGALNYHEDGGYTLVYFAFPYECIAPNPTSATPRRQILENILDWFDTFITLPPITVSLPQLTGDTGQDIDVPVTCSPVMAEHTIYQYDISITYDPDVIELVSPYLDLTGSILAPDWAVNIVSNQPGEFSASASTSLGNYLIGEGVIGTLKFNIVGDPEDYSDIAFASFVTHEAAGIITENGGVTVNTLSVGDENGSQIPSEFRISSVSPNPFNPVANITLAIPAEGLVSASIYNISGAKTADVYNGQLSAGYHTFQFDGTHLSSGIYFLKVVSAQGTAAEKIVLMK